jgi:hypothetical protein
MLLAETRNGQHHEYRKEICSKALLTSLTFESLSRMVAEQQLRSIGKAR